MDQKHVGKFRKSHCSDTEECHEKRRHHERISVENGRGNGICLSIYPFWPVTRFAFCTPNTKVSKFC